MLGIFGGTFDPIHFGHIKSVLALLKSFDFEHVRCIPCQQSPGKQEVYAELQHRWEMLKLVTDAHAKLVADDRELRRSGPSYTIDTLMQLRDEAGTQKALVLIVGVDAFLSFCEWYKYDEILSYCHIMLLQRPGYKLPEEGCEKELYDTCITGDILQLAEASNGHIYLSDEEKIDISSTAIRSCVAAGEQPRYLLPGNVWSYIRMHNLYQ